MSLRDAIKPKHDAAEAHPFTAFLLSGSISKEAYGDLLYNYLVIYEAIEERIKAIGSFNDVPEIFRVDQMMEDLQELQPLSVEAFPSTAACVARVNVVTDHDLMAYFYLYHMADMYGGQMIRKTIPGSARRFDFENRPALIARIREKLTDDLADEANVAFDFTLDLFDELAAKHNLSAA
jgi:heme oxygenase